MKLNIRDIIETETAMEGMFTRPLAEIERKLKNDDCADRDTLCDLRDTLLREKNHIKRKIKDSHQENCEHALWMMTGEPYLDDDMVTYASCTCVSCLMEMPFDEASYLNLYNNKRLIVDEKRFASGDFDLMPPADVTVSDVRDHYFNIFNEQAIVGDDFYSNHDVETAEEEVVRYYSRKHVLTK